MIKFCSLFGNNDINFDYDKMKKAIISVIETKKITEFYIGHNGHFDARSRTCLLEIKKQYPQIKIYVVIAYFDKIEEFKHNEIEYAGIDGFIYPDIENIPTKYAIIERNKWMIKNSSFIIFYIDFIHHADKLMHFAILKKKNFINLGKLKLN